MSGVELNALTGLSSGFLFLDLRSDLGPPGEHRLLRVQPGLARLGAGLGRRNRIRRSNHSVSRSDDERVADTFGAMDQLAPLVERVRAEFTRSPLDGLAMRP